MSDSINPNDYLHLVLKDEDGEHKPPKTQLVCPPGTTTGPCPKCKKYQGANILTFQQPIGTRTIYKCRVCGTQWEPNKHPIDKWYGS